MIDEQIKTQLRDRIISAATDEQIANYAENLRLERVPLCGSKADTLPYFREDTGQG